MTFLKFIMTFKKNNNKKKFKTKYTRRNKFQQVEFSNDFTD